MPDIYETILNHASCWIATGTIGEDGSLNPASALIGLKERDRGSVDGALFRVVSAEALAPPGIQAMIPLLSHYIVWEGRADVELTDAGHSAAVETFLDAIMDTWPMRSGGVSRHRGF